MSINQKYPDLKNKNPIVRERIMQQIVEEYNEETINQLIEVLDSEDADYRRTVVKTLNLIGLDAVPALLKELNQTDNSLAKASCINALSSISNQDEEERFLSQILTSLQQALEDPNPMVQLSSVGAIETFGEQAFDILTAAIASENLLVQVAVVNALGSLGDPRGLDVLSSLSQDQTVDPYVKELAVSALSRLEQVIKFNS
ncbi:HEAT domain containing protein [Stanieria cyanosphaera PCC 7437]|uniref:HEAT domain containing protein n=1 Tax=Stanieria cyanosphaera (strain ATCC 29371 / PCC 7437) TaxID=111780 RepID=K9Y1A8_STAC7|nr:HEAT repeat domain-containing protein [Stanieria cyanosphaera]AFZ37757.1 HEAT domain containing protein [Stanieria cyanosphaera PCC 7437]